MDTWVEVSFTCTNSKRIGKQSCRMDAPTGMGVKENEKLKSEIALCSGPGFAAPALALGILFSPRGVSRGTHVRQVTPVT